MRKKNRGKEKEGRIEGSAAKRKAREGEKAGRKLTSHEETAQRRVIRSQVGERRDVREKRTKEGTRGTRKREKKRERGSLESYEMAAFFSVFARNVRFSRRNFLSPKFSEPVTLFMRDISDLCLLALLRFFFVSFSALFFILLYHLLLLLLLRPSFVPAWPVPSMDAMARRWYPFPS